MYVKVTFHPISYYISINLIFIHINCNINRNNENRNKCSENNEMKLRNFHLQEITNVCIKSKM